MEAFMLDSLHDWHTNGEPVELKRFKICLKAVINCDVFKYEALKVAKNGPEESDDDDSIFDESLEALSSDDEVLPPTQRCCCICIMEEVTRAFLPCGHLVIGEACVDQYRLTSNLCPVCRSEYTTIQRMSFN